MAGENVDQGKFLSPLSLSEREREERETRNGWYVERIRCFLPSAKHRVSQPTASPSLRCLRLFVVRSAAAAVCHRACFTFTNSCQQWEKLYAAMTEPERERETGHEGRKAEMVSLFSLLGLGRAWKFLSRGGGDEGETSLNRS